MQLNRAYLCGLASAADFLAWLQGFDPDLHASLLGHLQQQHGCRENTRKALETIAAVLGTARGQHEFEVWLRRQYPQVLVLEANPVFSYYDPALCTLPRRQVLHGPDPAALVAEFGRFQGPMEHVIVGDKAYVEYVPPALANLAEAIPAENWEVRRYKRGNGQN